MMLPGIPQAVVERNEVPGQRDSIRNVVKVPVTDRSVQSENRSVRSRPVLTLLKQSRPSAASVRRVPELRLTLLVEGDG